MRPIAHIRCDLKCKFGVPRQARLVENLEASIVFVPEFRNREALRGLEEFSQLWLIWDFSEAHREKWSPTVRPPRLGGNKRMGVFATRSPFRPNPIGLSAVKIKKIDFDAPEAPIIYIIGADLIDGTPIFDIKPYLPFVDSIPDATNGFAEETRRQKELEVIISDEISEILRQNLTDNQISVLISILKSDPRPHYHDDEREYAFEFANLKVKFTVEDGKIKLNMAK